MRPSRAARRAARHAAARDRQGVRRGRRFPSIAVGGARHGQRRGRRSRAGRWTLPICQLRHVVAAGRGDATSPCATVAVLDADYTNEGGVDGSIRLLKNIMGLWIIQECKREWDRRGGCGELCRAGGNGDAKRRRSRPSSTWTIACFLAPGDMPARIQEYCRKDAASRVPEGTRRDRPRDLREPRAEVPLGHRAAGEGHAAKGHRRRCTSSAAAARTCCSTSFTADAHQARR